MDIVRMLANKGLTCCCCCMLLGEFRMFRRNWPAGGNIM